MSAQWNGPITHPMHATRAAASAAQTCLHTVQTQKGYVQHLAGGLLSDRVEWLVHTKYTDLAAHCSFKEHDTAQPA